MKYVRELTAGFAVLLIAGSAHAATVDLSGTNDNLGLVSYGQTGTIDNLITLPTGNRTAYLLGAAFGELPPDSEITFSYTFLHGAGSHGNLISTGTYDQTIGTRHYSSFSSSNGNGNYSYFTDSASAHPNHHVAAPSPVLATAHMGGNERHGNTTITNLSGVDVSFGSYFISFFQSLFGGGRGLGDVIVTYQVSGDPSALPLPGALPMFGAGLLALTGFAWAKKARKKSASTIR